MGSLALIILSTALVNNIVLAKFLGLCPFMGTSQKITHAVGMSSATAFVLTLTAGVCYLIQHYILTPLHLEFLQLIVFIITIATMVQFIELYIRYASAQLYQVLGVYLPLITTNCAVLGIALLVTSENHTLMSALTQGLGTALGFSVVLIIFSAMRERLALCDIPAPFKGSAIAFITAGILSVAFMGFIGMVTL
jgi:electron transport complex protein RnfA